MIKYEARESLWKLIFRRKGSVIPKALILAIPSALLAALFVIFDETASRVRHDVGVSNTQSSIIWSTVSLPLVSLIGYRTSQAVGRFWEGTSLLHAMRGEWFDSASCLATFSSNARARKPVEVDQFRQTLLRLMSLCHGSALDEIKMEKDEFFEALDIKGLDSGTLKILHNCRQLGFNRVEVLLHMIQVLVIDAMSKEIISVPAPILSRVYQTLSRGFVNLLNAKKIRDTQFPFPYAQLIAVLLMTLTVLTPLVMSAVFQDKIGWCIISTFMPVFSLLCLNYIAAELEMPYGTEDNDLPLHDFQMEMNSSLLMLIHLDSDHVPSTHQRTKTTYEVLSQSLQQNRASMFSEASKFSSVRSRSVYTEANESCLTPPVLTCPSEKTVLSSTVSLSPSLATIEEPDVVQGPGEHQIRLLVPRRTDLGALSIENQQAGPASPRSGNAAKLSPRGRGSSSPVRRDSPVKREAKAITFDTFTRNAAPEDCVAVKMSNKMSMSREPCGNNPAGVFLPPPVEQHGKKVPLKRQKKSGHSRETQLEREDVLDFTPPEEGPVPSVRCIPTAER